MRVTLKSRRPDHFWSFHILISVFLFLLLFGLQNSGMLLTRLTAYLYGPGHLSIGGRQLIPERVFYAVLLYGGDLILGYGLMVILSCSLNARRGSEKLAFLLCLAAELAAGLIRMLVMTEHILDPGHFIASLAGSLLALLFVSIHKRAFR